MPSFEVRTGCRLHFGLYSFGPYDPQRQVAQFGGVGVMIEEPHIHLRVAPAKQLSCGGLHPARSSEFVRLWHVHHALEPSPMVVEVLNAPDEHRGLGLGTALGMAVAAAMRAYYGMAPADAANLARSVGRGARSAVGAHGFIQGGLLAERGKTNPNELSPLEERVPLPQEWRFVLAVPKTDGGLYGEAEKKAFRSASVSSGVRQMLMGIAHEELLPAAKRGDFHAFGQAVYRYGHAAGECFSSIQKGAYNGPEVTALVAAIRATGVQGVGQSSWGPTVYAVCESESQAAGLVEHLEATEDLRDLRVTRCRETGAKVFRLE